jgi:hypothetical protein
MPNLVVSAVAKWNGTALKKGERQITQFQKTTNLLAKSFAAAFATRKIVQFGKASVAAFAADEKAAKSLSIALQNTGNGFATIATEGFIARMQQTYKVLDDELRPAFQTLLTATGSITKAQQGLELALNVSAGTTNDLVTVAKALSRGYAGNTQGLSRLNAGLSKAILKTNDMEQITTALSMRFKGQALGALNTYAKKMDALTIAAENSKEAIGKGLLDSIAALGGNDGITKAADSMETLSQNVADTIYGFSLLISKAQQLREVAGFGSGGAGLFGATGLGALGGFAVGGPGGALVGGALGLTAARTAQMTSQYGKNERLKNTPYSSTSMYFTPQQAEQGKKLFDAQKKQIDARKKELELMKEKNKLTAAELADKKKQAELDTLKKKFDLERINLETALANSKDEAEKARIRSLLTIMDEDVNAAARRLAELDKSNAARLQQEYLAAISLGNLAEAAKLAAMGVSEIKLAGIPLSQYETYKDNPIFQKAAEIEAQGIANNAAKVAKEAEEAAAAALAIADNSEAILQEYMATIAGLRIPVAGSGSGTVNNITINTPVGSEEALTEAVQKAVQQINRYGFSSTYAGAIPTP